MKEPIMSRVLRIIPLTLIAVLFCPFTYGKVIYVDDDATETSDGSSWANAYEHLQDALAVANGSKKPVEIRVAQGIYRPDQGASQTLGNREATFQLINGVTIAGGYAGLAKPDPNTRDIERYKTILSGDLASNDVNEKDARNFLNEPSCSENSYHVLTGSGIDETSMLDGFTITAGSANGDYYDYEPHSEGGGMYVSSSQAKLINCSFTGNSASNRGGGIYATDSNLVFADCLFSENSASGGGGIANDENSNPTLSGCSFIGNVALGHAGAMLNQNNSHSTLTNCIFSGNSAARGGGMRNERNGGATLIYCTFTQNTVKYPFGLPGTQAKVMITGSIFWGNTPTEMYRNAVISYSNIEGGWPGAGNINTDPFFADPGRWVDRNNPNIVVEPDDPNAVSVVGDYHLKSQAGRWDPSSQSWVKDDLTSPCIDAFDTQKPAGDEPMPNGGRINMGAYGGTTQASMSPTDDMRISVSKQASNPRPGNRKSDYSRRVELSWTAGLNAVSHDVYFGPNNPPPFIRNQTATEFDPGKLEIYDARYYLRTRKTDKTYYWRIDEIDEQGRKWPGDLWTFTIMIPKGRACFLANTPAWIDGKHIPISTVQHGQIINDVGIIEDVQEHKGAFVCYDILLQSGNCITVAENHYFMAESGQWLSLQNLKAGIRLKTLKGSIGIARITKKPKPFVGKVYNLRIEGSDRYLVGEDAIIVRDY